MDIASVTHASSIIVVYKTTHLWLFSCLKYTHNVCSLQDYERFSNNSRKLKNIQNQCLLMSDTSRENFHQYFINDSNIQSIDNRRRLSQASPRIGGFNQGYPESDHEQETSGSVILTKPDISYTR